MAQTKISQLKEKDFEKVEPQINFTDMTDTDQDIVVEICRNAYSKY